MTTATKKRFDPEFRLEAAQLVVDQNYTVKEACGAMRVSKSTVESRIRKLRAERGGKAPVGVAITPDQIRIQELERKLKRVEEEKEILKKATVDSTGHCNIMKLNHYRGFQNTDSFKIKGANYTAETGAVG